MLLWLVARQLFLWVPFDLPVSGPSLSTDTCLSPFPPLTEGEVEEEPCLSAHPGNTLDSDESMAEAKQLWDFRCASDAISSTLPGGLMQLRKRLTHMQPFKINRGIFTGRKICSRDAKCKSM